MKHIVPLIFTLSATAAFAEDTRELDSHEHGVGELNIALDGTTIAMEFHAPGADIVGFEYEATSDEDLAKIAAAIEVLERPLDLFVVPAAAGCEVTRMMNTIMMNTVKKRPGIPSSTLNMSLPVLIRWHSAL